MTCCAKRGSSKTFPPFPRRRMAMKRALLRGEGILEDVSSAVAIRVLVMQLQIQLEEQGISKAELARRLGMSRSQVDRLLSGDESGIKLSTLERAAKAVNRSIVLQLT